MTAYTSTTTPSPGPGSHTTLRDATVDWFNNRRLHTELGDIPPTGHETNHYRQITASTTLETREPSLH